MKKLLTLLTLAVLGITSVANAQTWWRATSSTNVSEEQTYVDDDALTIKTVYAGKVSGYSHTYTTDGQKFDSSIQIRVDAAPSTTNVTGTQKADCTPLIFSAKKNTTITFYYRRQSNNGKYESNDGKDMKLVNQSAPTTVIDAESFTIDGTATDYDYAIKTYKLKKDATYTLWARGTTVSLNGFSYDAGAKTAITVNNAKSNNHAYLDNAGTISADATSLSFSNYPMSVDGANIQVGNAQYQFVVNGKNYTGVKFSKNQTYVITPAAGVTISSVKAYGSSNSSSSITIASGESNSKELEVRGDKNKPVTMEPLTLSVNDEGYFFFKLSGNASQAILVFDVTYDQVENVDVKISSAGYATLYYGSKLEIPDGITAYTAALSGTDKVVLTKINSVIPANTGVILKADEGTYNICVSSADADAIGTNDLKGTTTGTTVTANTVYTLGQDGDGEVGLRLYSGTSIRAYSAYMEAPTTARSLKLVFADEATSINSLETVKSSTSKKYLLNGRLLIQNSKGLFTIDGIQVK
ncbi:MAG: hypothetical protein IKR50_12220 [Prevotella sp.]|nr:hypothetical protein [Prevotella sp.]